MKIKVLKRVIPLIGLAAFLIAAQLGIGSPGTSLEAHSHHEMNMLDTNMISDVAAAAVTTPPNALPRTGWIATASDQETTAENSPASNAIDGDVATVWHSKWSGTPAPLPHWITLDMKTTQSLTGLSVLPRQNGNTNGFIGQYSVSVSADGTNWGSPVASGTWIDDSTQKTSTFSATGQYLRLTAISEAGDSGPWTAIAELYALGAGSQPPPQVSPLPRTGWTAAASDEETTGENGAAANVLDGSSQTIWHSKWSGTPTPLPHWITLDMKAVTTVSGVTYLPRQDFSNGNIGAYSIYVSTDGTNWGTPRATGTWADNQTLKTVAFTAVQARYVRITATTEAGNRGPWSSASEINVLGNAPAVDPSLGKWAAPLNLPNVPVSAVVLPNNKLLTFSAYLPDTFNTSDTNTWVSIVDLGSGNVGAPTNVTSTTHQMFCTGLALLADGRVLIDGGSSDRATTIYDPFSNTWTKGPLLNTPRAYQGDTLLSTGQVLTLGGSWKDGAGGKDGEVFTPSGTTGSWSRRSGITADKILTADPAGVFRADNHAWLFATSNGGVFHAGPSKQMNWITTAGNGSITSAGNRGTSDDAMNGNAVMYDVGKIFTAGGAPAYEDSHATQSAYVVDISRGPSQPVITTRTSDMAYRRAFNNSVVMPDGKVLVVGGQEYPKPFTDTSAATNPEMWDPATGKFTVLAAQSSPRTYHSVAALLPDGRVFSGGGGLCGTCGTNHLDGEIFTPPNLLDAAGNARPRPVINTAPSTTTTGSTITVTTNAATPKFALIRTSAVTHSLNNDQRRIPLTPVTTNGTTYTLKVPADKGVALPGYYMLFALDANGTPSVAKFIKIS